MNTNQLRLWAKLALFALDVQTLYLSNLRLVFLTAHLIHSMSSWFEIPPTAKYPIHSYPTDHFHPKIHI